MKNFWENFWGWRLGYWQDEKYTHFYSVWHFIFLAALAAFIILICIRYRKKTEKQAKTFLKILSVILILLEIIRIIWRVRTRIKYIEEGGNVLNIGECISFAFCTQMIFFIAITFLIDKEKWNKLAYNMIYASGIIAGGLALFYPTSILNTYYPFYHAMTLQTLISHGAMLFISLFLVTSRLYKPQIKKIWFNAICAVCFMIIAFIANTIWGCNFIFDNLEAAGSLFEKWFFPFNMIPLLIALIALSSLTFIPFIIIDKRKAARCIKI